MKTKDLIEKLKKFDPESTPHFFGSDGDWEPVSNVVDAPWPKPAIILRGLSTGQKLRNAIKSGRLS